MSRSCAARAEKLWLEPKWLRNDGNDDNDTGDDDNNPDNDDDNHNDDTKNDDDTQELGSWCQEGPGASFERFFEGSWVHLDFPVEFPVER